MMATVGYNYVTFIIFFFFTLLEATAEFVPREEFQYYSGQRLSCRGHENSLQECRTNFGSQVCYNNDEIRLSCQPNCKWQQYIMYIYMC